MGVMRYSFSYCGIPCEDFGLRYIPDQKARAFDQAEYTPITETVTARVGSNWFGNTVKNLDFTLLCFYEDLTPGEQDAIYRWMHKDTVGELRFVDRPWCYYIVRPSKKPAGDNYVVYDAEGNGRFSGKITFYLTCYEAYARIDRTYTVSTSGVQASLPTGEVTEADWESAKDFCGLVETSQMPYPSAWTATAQAIYNPGTEITNHVKISIAGSAPNGVTIGNYTTGEVCKLTSLPENKTLIQNSELGTVTYQDTGDYAFSYHNFGYITLAGCGAYRKLWIASTANSATITSNEQFRKATDVGKYVFIGSAWYKILSVTNFSSAILDRTVNVGGEQETIMATMNEIYVQGEDVNLTDLKIEYTPLVR